MYRIARSIHIPFAHHVRGHRGACISLHGHTWKFEIHVVADDLDAEGFVIDFSEISRTVLRPCHRLLDHALAIGEETWAETEQELSALGQQLVRSRLATMGDLGEQPRGYEGALAGATNRFPGGIKVAVFPFAPTSERLARWLYELGDEVLATQRVQIEFARVYESLHPAESYADYRP